MGSRQSPEYKELLRAHGCAYCGEGCNEITLDHVQAKAAGGKDSRANIVPACETCNSMKGSLGVIEFYARCKKISKIFPRLWRITGDNRATWRVAEKVRGCAAGGAP
jgi:5-methylcytosine-specific restriction endonuclease McrA